MSFVGIRLKGEKRVLSQPTMTTNHYQLTTNN